METGKVLSRPLPLVCFVVLVSFFCLIDNSQGASSELRQGSTKEIEHKPAPILSAQNSPKSSSGESEGRTGLFSRPMFRKRRRSTTQSTVRTSTVPSNLTLSDRVDDLEYSFDNETLVEKRNKTVTPYDNVQEEDNLCPEHGTKRVVVQSTLPAYEMILFAIVNVAFFVVFLYFWKNIYYDQDDLYATVSPYGFGPGPTTPAPKARSSDRLDEIMSTVQKSIER